MKSNLFFKFFIKDELPLLDENYFEKNWKIFEKFLELIYSNQSLEEFCFEKLFQVILN